MTTTDVERAQIPEDRMIALVATLGPLQMRYFAQRLTNPERPPEEIMDALKLSQEAKVRWKFPAEMEHVIDELGAVEGLTKEVGSRLLEMYIPEAAATLVRLMGSGDEKIALRAAERLLEGKGVLTRAGTTINIGGDHRSISMIAKERLEKLHPSE